jgi:tetratricopeptide (TPR) repeat protein
LSELSSASCDLGKFGAALDAARELIEIAAARGISFDHAEGLTAYSAALAGLGDGDAARIAAEDALTIIRPLGYLNLELNAWLVLARSAEILNSKQLVTQAQAEVARIKRMLAWPEDVEFPPLGLATDT